MNLCGSIFLIRLVSVEIPGNKSRITTNPNIDYPSWTQSKVSLLVGKSSSLRIWMFLKAYDIFLWDRESSIKRLGENLEWAFDDSWKQNVSLTRKSSIG